MTVYNQIAVTSVNRAVNRARATGKLNLEVLAIYDLYKYYIEFTEGVALYKDQNKCLKVAIEDLKYKYPEICKYNEYVPTVGYDAPGVNIAPTVSGTTIPLLTEDEYWFTAADFTTNFSDVGSPDIVLLYLTGVPGTFTLNGTVVTGTIAIPIEDIVTLKYTRVDDTAFSEALTFRVSDDDPINPLYTAITTNTLTGAAAANQPATVGDNTIYTANRAVTVLTLAMFTSDLTPPYNDPETDLIDAIRLDEISTANLGTFLLNGTPVVEGQIITREDINAGFFTHSAPNQDALSSDNFSFSARDEGSLIWVQ
jgi:hypothetical protein